MVNVKKRIFINLYWDGVFTVTVAEKYCTKEFEFNRWSIFMFSCDTAHNIHMWVWLWEKIYYNYIKYSILLYMKVGLVIERLQTVVLNAMVDICRINRCLHILKKHRINFKSCTILYNQKAPHVFIIYIIIHFSMSLKYWPDLKTLLLIWGLSCNKTKHKVDCILSYLLPWLHQVLHPTAFWHFIGLTYFSMFGLSLLKTFVFCWRWEMFIQMTLYVIHAINHS